MKTISRLFLFAFIGIGLISCQNEDGVETLDNTSNLKVVSFIYDGITYSSTYKLDKDSLMVFDDNDFRVLYTRLDSLPQLATYVHSDGLIEYFDNSEIAEAKVISVNSNGEIPKLRVSGSGSIALFEHENMQGSRIDFDFGITLNPYNLGVQVPFVATYIWRLNKQEYFNFNDMASSFTVNASGSYNKCIVWLYENKDYGGKSLIFTFYYPNSPFKVYNLGDYKISNGSLFSHSKSWHDQVSSLKVSLSD